MAGIVEWFGAMQAQDMASGLWSLGARLPGRTLDDVNAALERREAIRTWPMRGTVHLVPPADAHWMLDLMGVRALAGAAKRREILGLDEETADRGVEVLGAALAGGGRLTRAECLAALADGGVALSRADGLPPALVREPARRHLHRPARRQGADVRAARRVGARRRTGRPARRRWASSRCAISAATAPTTGQDFAGWTGLTDDRRARPASRWPATR